jgi:hydroxyethylthiazole kinase-like uncharacterized protein yjeF
MKILSAEQIRQADAYTIQHEPVSSYQLMERAARACVRRLIRLITPDDHVFVACGKGNNGGDGLAITRLMNELGFRVRAIVVNHSSDFSQDALENYTRLKEQFPGQISDVNTLEELQEQVTDPGAIWIDALLGTGLSRPVSGLLEEVILYLNAQAFRIISIDLPSGLYADQSSEGNAVIRSSLTLTFQLPKLAFMMADNQHYVPEFELLDISLHEQGLSEQKTLYHYLSKADICPLLRPRTKFSHKGTFGHALLIAGSRGKSGAAIIASKACLRSGAGLLTLHANKETLASLLLHLPEAMGTEDPHPDHPSETGTLDPYTAIGFGPGTGTHEDTQRVLKKILHYYKGPLVIDADGLNILSENRTWLEFLPPGTILTPHPREFERLTEKHENGFARLEAARRFSSRYQCILLLKGAHSAIVMPDGHVFFNSTGNASLAKGGSGDGLTGIILGLLSRGYNAPQSALIGTFIHGYAADLCARRKSKESLLISDVIESLPKAFHQLEKLNTR